MVRFRLRTKLVLSLIVTTAALTGVSLLVVQNYLEQHARQEIQRQLTSAIASFEEFAQQRQKVLAQTAAISADLPTIKALMTTRHERTIQDASTDFWRLTESDLFLLADPAGNVMALNESAGKTDRDAAGRLLARTLETGRGRDWWFAGGRLYEVFLQPIYFGGPADNSQLGILAAGFAVDNRLAGVFSRIVSADVAFRYGSVVVGSSLSPARNDVLSQNSVAVDPPSAPREMMLADENFLGASTSLLPEGDLPVTLTVLKSYDAATLFLSNVNRLLLGVGMVAVVAGAALMFLISHTLTKPLSRLVSGVVALKGGDFTYPLKRESDDELGNLTAAFDEMRNTLRQNQRKLIHAERLATIGRMASTISHDLRHPLTTVLAYAELLTETGLSESERQDLYREIRLSVDNMAELIASLLEFSKAQEALKPLFGDVGDTLQRTIDTLRLRPEFKRAQITLQQQGSAKGWFDFNKLDRVFRNVLQNACEAAPPDFARISIHVVGAESHVEVSVSDNGCGIPANIQAEIFQPFVTYGKSGGTGLGLAVVDKIVRDHGGDVRIESSGPDGTTVKLTLPLLPSKALRVS